MIVDMFVDAVGRAPRRLAVADGRSSLKYSQLLALSLVLKRIVERETQCERVGVLLPASAAFPATLMGILWASRVAVPLNFLLSEQELSHIVTDAGLDLILSVRHFQPLAANLPARMLFLEDLGLKRRVLLASLRSKPRTPAVAADDTAVILYTSGTTALPKGVELTHRNLFTNCQNTIESLGIEQGQVFLNVLPPFHVFGLTGTVLVPIALGATVHAIPRFSAVTAFKTIEAGGVTILMAVPSMYAAMLRTKSARRSALESVQLAVSGGEPLSDSVRDQFQERFGISLRQGYGLTETSPVIAVCGATVWKDGTVGRPIRNTVVTIVGENGEQLAPGEDGEICVRGPGVMKGYYKQPAETAQLMDPAFGFRTGDIGHLDADGFLVITGRSKEMMIIGGENVFPREIEAALEATAGVLQAAVIGVPDDLRGEAPVAFVIPQEGAAVSEQSLRESVKACLAGFKVPKRVVIRADLPTGPTGKILKRKLEPLL